MSAGLVSCFRPSVVTSRTGVDRIPVLLSFGEIGQILFHQTLKEIFIDPSPERTQPHLPVEPLVTTQTASPLTPSDFLYFVLIPELAIILIQEDLALARPRDAFDVMAASREYGNSRFAAEEGEKAGGVLMRGFIDGDVVEDNGIQAMREKVGEASGSTGASRGHRLEQRRRKEVYEEVLVVEAQPEEVKPRRKGKAREVVEVEEVPKAPRPMPRIRKSMTGVLHENEKPNVDVPSSSVQEVP